MKLTFKIRLSLVCSSTDVDVDTYKIVNPCLQAVIVLLTCEPNLDQVWLPGCLLLLELLIDSPPVLSKLRPIHFVLRQDFVFLCDAVLVRDVVQCR